MRIITGSLGGRQFDSPPGHRTHPMSEKARGALFNVLGDVDGLTLLDAFAGSGAIAFEAISRGAKSAVALDIDKAAYKTIKENSEKLGTKNQVLAVRTNAGSWSNKNQERTFDIVVCDPPYNQLQSAPLEKLVKHVKEGGVYVLSWPPSQGLPRFPELEQLSLKDYGDASLVFYRRIS